MLGHPAYGGASDYGVNELVSSGVQAIYSTDYAFAALKPDGRVVTWGDRSRGGESADIAPALSSGVVYANQNAFAALKVDRNVVAWGDNALGGHFLGVRSARRW